MKKILVLANSDVGLYKFRKEVLSELKKEYDVLISVPEGKYTPLLKDMGYKIYITPISRRSVNPLKDLVLFFKYFKLLMKLKPDCVLTYTIKPNIYGGIACRLLGIKYLVNITGLGTAIEKKNLLSKILLRMYGCSLKKASVVFFQNKHNQKLLNTNIHINAKQLVLPGSGVNIQEYPYLEYPTDLTTTNFLFIGRIMEAKGINELLLGYNLLAEKYDNVSMTIIGPLEEEYKTELFNSMVKKNIVNYLGEQTIINEFINNCHALINPSHHEGMSNVLLEAGASGRPLLASNIPGCQEIIDDGFNGYLFQPHDYYSLFEALEKFHLLEFHKKKLMGEKSSIYIRENFNRNIIVKHYFNAIEGD